MALIRCCWSLRRRGGLNETVIAAFDVRMILVARNQNEVMPLSFIVTVVQGNTRWGADARDFTTVVDRFGDDQVQPGAGRNQIV